MCIGRARVRTAGGGRPDEAAPARDREGGDNNHDTNE